VLEVIHLGQELVHLVGLEILAKTVCHGVEAIHQRLDRRDGFQEILPDGLVQVELRLLGDVAYPHVFGEDRLALEVLVDPGHDAKQRRLAGPVLAHDADLGAVEERKVDVSQDDPVVVNLADITHFKDESGRHWEDSFQFGQESNR